MCIRNVRSVYVCMVCSCIQYLEPRACGLVCVSIWERVVLSGLPLVCVRVCVCFYVRWFAWQGFLFYSRQVLNNKSTKNKEEERKRQDTGTRRGDEDRRESKKEMWRKGGEQSGRKRHRKGEDRTDKKKCSLFNSKTNITFSSDCPCFV